MCLTLSWAALLAPCPSGGDERELLKWAQGLGASGGWTEAFANGQYNRAHAVLTDALPQVVRIGGSRAQRRLVSETISAAHKAMQSA